LRDGSFLRGDGVAHLPHFRFAVASFESWQQLRHALEDLRGRGLSPDSFNCLALKHVLTGQAVPTIADVRVRVEELVFSEIREPICCTPGPLASCLTERLRLGARNLKEALGHWLVPRHAAQFQEAVDKGMILLWIRLDDAGEERNAYQSLLTNSLHSVGVHDLVALGRTRSNGKRV
jgi:hypothetical protein